MDKKININEMFYMMIIFEIGTSVLFCLGIDAKQDSWIAVIFAMIISFPIIVMYIKIFLKSNMNFANTLQYTFGNYLGKFFSFLYGVYFFYIASRNLRDFVDLSICTLFPRTHIYIFLFSMVLVVMYYLSFGIISLARISKIILPFILIIMGLQFILIGLSRHFEPTRILPVFENGIFPVLKAAFPLLVTFPFGELIAFLIIFNDVTEKNKIMKYTLYAFFISGFILSFNNFIIISSIGVFEASRSNFPLYQVIRLLSLGGFTNFDTFYVFVMSIGIFFKITIFTYAGLKIYKELFNLKNYKSIILPVAAILIGTSIIIADSYSTHILIGLKITPFYIHIPMQIIIPLFVFIILYMKKKRKSI